MKGKLLIFIFVLFFILLFSHLSLLYNDMEICTIDIVCRKFDNDMCHVALCIKQSAKYCLSIPLFVPLFFSLSIFLMLDNGMYFVLNSQPHIAYQSPYLFHCSLVSLSLLSAIF